MTGRLPFVLEDLEQEIRSVAPQVGTIVIHLPAGAFKPVIDDLAHHDGIAPTFVDAVQRGSIVIRKT